MGDIADMMIDGELCEGCGEYLGPGDGYTRRCASCERFYKPSEKVKCAICGRNVKAVGLMQHQRDSHGK